MIRAILLIITIGLVGCGEIIDCPGTYNKRHMITPLSFKISDDFSDSQKNTIREAAKSWNLAYGETIVWISRNDGFPITLVADLPGNVQALTTSTFLQSNIMNTKIEVAATGLDTVDLESVMVHEFGHALGLGHVNGTVMDPYIYTGEIRREIDPTSLNMLHCLY